MSTHFSLAEIEGSADDFEKNELLGSGGEGKVVLSEVCVNQKKTIVAVKQLNANSNEFEKEIKTFSSIQHPNVVSLLGHCQESDHKILIYEYMQNGSLAKYLKKNSPNYHLSWLQRLNICLGAARGLQYLHTPTNQHSKGIIHRDVKPDNILLSEDWVAKVADFGMSKLSDADQKKSTMISDIKGTRGYFAPEYINNYQVTRKIDVYAFGVVLFQVLCRQMPREQEESINLYDNKDLGDMAKQNVDPNIKGEISEDSLEIFTDIIRRSLNVLPNYRPNMDAVVLDLEKALRYQKYKLADDLLEGYRPKAPSFLSYSRPANWTIGGGDEYDDTIVLDIGGANTKIGFAKDESPRAVFAKLVGYGSDYERSLHHYALYQEHNNQPEKKHPVLLTESPLEFDATESRRKEYRTHREKMTEVMFDKFQVPAMYIAMRPVLSLFARGSQITGVVVESGENVSKSVPIYEGYVLPHAITSLNMAGRDLTNHLKKILTEDRGYSLDKQALDEIVRDVKEKLAYVALDYNLELMVSSRTLENNYTLPDGKLIAIGTERFQCPEALFDPSMVGMRVPGIHEITYNSITKCNADIRDELYGNIVLAGGTTMLRGIDERMEEEIRVMAPRRKVIKVSPPCSTKYSAWVGGCKLASLSTFNKMWISKAEYEEYGANIVHKKCF